MARKDYVTLLLLLVGAAIGGYGMFTDSGPVGWLNELQQRLFGSYRRLVSFGVVVATVMLAGGLLWDGVRRLLGRPGDKVVDQVLFGPQAPRPAQAPTGRSGQALFRHQAKVLLLCGLAGIVLTWTIGSLIYRWNVREREQDASAAYAEVDLAQGAPSPGGTAHLALRGIPVTEWVVTHTNGSASSSSQDFQLIPMVGVGWKPGSPVNVVVKLGRGGALPNPLDRPPKMQPRNPREVVLLARRSGSIPAAALPEFKKMGVQIQAEAILVRPVPTLGGKPVPPDTSGSFDTMLILCSMLSGIMLVFTLALWAALRVHARRVEGLGGPRP